jgi:hypothetical protein
MDMWKYVSSRIRSSSAAILDLPELDVPLRKMINPVSDDAGVRGFDS